MMKNRAGLVALLVLAIAAVVMIFFVLPNRDKAGKLAEDAAQGISDSAKSAVDGASEAVKSLSGEAAEKADRLKEAVADAGILEKVDRLKSNADAAADALQKLFANGRIPSSQELTDAKAKAEAALLAIAEFEAPEGAEVAVGNVVSGMKDKASQALDLVKSMPADAESAAQAVAGLQGLFGPAKTVESAAASQPATAAEEQSAGMAAVIPAFDILRVEKDGSTVIAGKGEPGTTVELMDGDQVISSQTIGQSGDFAMVLDNPLSVGDHQLVLRSMANDGKVTTSDEVATVSVPSDAEGELLAMVSKPGEASRILTMPEAKEGAATAATESAEPAKPETTTQEVAVEAAATSDAATTNAPETAATETAEADTGAEAAVDASTEKAAETSEAVTTAAETAEGASGAAEVRVSAVELEGDKIFVAGEAKSGAMLKIYADDQLVGEAIADTNGHFVADGTLSLDVGNHIIRADVVEPDSGKVIVRASVPFTRPEGERVAVAANDDLGAAAATADTNALATQLTQLREEVAKALVLLKGLFADGKTPAADELAAARSATQIALNALASFKPGLDVGAELIAQAEKAAGSAAAALKILEGAGDDPAALAAAIDGVEKAAADAINPVTGNVVETGDAISSDASGATSTEKTAEQPVTAEPAPTEESAANTEAEQGAPKTIEQKPLEASDSSVIIRRGDTLWQISRRLYGKGIRYTTIYLANEKKIGDPNVINPGQVFMVPEKTLEDDLSAEETNKRLQSR